MNTFTQIKYRAVGGEFKTRNDFARGDFAEIMRRSNRVLVEMGLTDRGINHRLATYHAKRHDKPCSTQRGMVVREVTRNFLKEKAEKAKRIAELAA